MNRRQAVMSAASNPGSGGSGRLTLGVEEEFLLVEPETGHVLPIMDRAVAAMDAQLRPYTRVEFHTSQLELASPVRTELADLADTLIGLRRAAAAGARAAGGRLLA
ncbi:MAG TPA: glutamate-cysteine ligase family protein, partial [Micromonosporaceae bacterium]|nr:glutamate-cysteine ligase family protein [Micromonosporaceae bacterium]